MNVNAKEKQIHRYRKQNCGYQRERERGRDKIRIVGLTDINYYI